MEECQRFLCWKYQHRTSHLVLSIPWRMLLFHLLEMLASRSLQCSFGQLRRHKFKHLLNFCGDLRRQNRFDHKSLNSAHDDNNRLHSQPKKVPFYSFLLFLNNPNSTDDRVQGMKVSDDWSYIWCSRRWYYKFVCWCLKKLLFNLSHI